MDKEWRDIKGYEGLYKISSNGDIYSVIRGKERKLKISKSNGYVLIDINSSKSG